MDFGLTSDQVRAQCEFRQFVLDNVVPHADAWDREQRIPASMFERMAESGYLGAIIPRRWGGMGIDMVSFGLLSEEFGKACSSLRSLLTVQSMVAGAILRWGTADQKRSWLPRLGSGELLAAFALTEPEAGSDAQAVVSHAHNAGPAYRLNGQKCWVSFGQVAGLFLVVCRDTDAISTFLVERQSAGLSVEPVVGMLGVRASMLARLNLRECEIPLSHRLGRQGSGWQTVTATALDLGRYSVAWGCVGIAAACLEASVGYTRVRHQFGVPLKDHQLVRRMIADMHTNVRAARLLCLHAGLLKDRGDPSAILETLIAKYFASSAAMRAATDAVELHGANGCSGEYPVQRYYRDAKIMEIIEGSTEIQQLTIGSAAYDNASLPLDTYSRGT
ncbi:MAG: acyl-CoA dehydrogenase family protein [Chloroflexi bacterium]|nr:acyl-CoA dehydrogenase family protein [Chloroflexota bacterium]